MFQGDATRQKKNFIALDEVIDDNRTFFIRFLLKARLKVPHSVFHSQAWIQRRWGQTGTNFLKKRKKKKSLKAKSTRIHLKQQSLVPRLKKTQKPQFSSARRYPGHVGYIDEVLCNLKIKDWAR